VDFNPAVGGEITKIRPAVVVSNDSANRHLNRVAVVPLTSNTTRLFASQAYVELEGQRRKAMADQLMTVSKLRFRRLAGRLTRDAIVDIERAIRTHLSL
jgi:mRNA interferase MazF